MAWKGTLRKIDDNRWEIPEGHVKGMRTNAIIFANESMVPQIMEDNAAQQAANVACLPGIVGSSLAMPDVHWGYGFPIGGVAAVNADDGHISPGGIGFDINCGVRLIRTDLRREDVKGKINDLTDELYKNIPSGLGSKGIEKVTASSISDILMTGSEWAVGNGYGWEKDLGVTEEGGRMPEADPKYVSDKAVKRGFGQVGSLGSGNHFIEIDVVEKVYDTNAAKAFGLFEGQITITVHCGSRGCGHQIATDHLQTMEQYIKRNRIELPDRQLACAPLSSAEGDSYYRAMSCGANYAWANRQMITHWIRGSFENVLRNSPESMGMNVVYDVAHNIAKKERHRVNGKMKDVLVHRKGATRAFPAEHPDVPSVYRNIGQPVIVPGDMSAGTYVLVGLPGAMDISFGSSCHGAGRKMSRKAAFDRLSVDDLRNSMRSRNIYLKSGTDQGVLDEAPEAYKDVDQVVSVVCDSGLTGKVAKLRPLGVVKG
ncbi:MAG: RtcB family protein [Methanomassiliicoccaceae archaeon]|jgi:tRNA-splicing ligase RtcB|nr:RtcB family protein [Methanomassiliicoccaceae archaeon]